MQLRKKLHLGLFFLVFFLISLIEGIRFILDIRFLYYVLFIVPLILFLLDSSRTYTLPKGYVWIVAIYVFFSTISLIHSKQFGDSLELYLRDISLILLSIYAHKQAQDIKIMLPRSIVFLSLLFIFVSVVLLITKDGREFIAGVRLNLLFNPAYPHKAIGDYLTFALLICTYGFMVLRERKWLISLLLILPIFILSFSRTAYIAVGLTTLYMLIILRKKLTYISPGLYVSVGINIFFAMFFFILFVTRINHSVFSAVQNSLEPSLSIFARPFLLSRLPFWSMGLAAFQDVPFTGFGQGSFPFISYRYMTELFLPTLTSFNLYIDTLAEQGMGASISLISLCVYLIWNAKKSTLYYFLFIALLVGFMGFSTFTYIQIWMIFFIVIGLILKQTRKNTYIITKSTLIAIASIGVVYIQVMTVHTLLIHNGFRTLAHTIYPYNRDNVRTLIAMSGLYLGNAKKTDTLLTQYKKSSAMDAFVLEEVGDRYQLLGNVYERKALDAYKESFTWGKYAYGDDLHVRMVKFYTLSKKLDGEKETINYIQSFLNDYQKLIKKDKREIHEKTYNAIKTLITKKTEKKADN